MNLPHALDRSVEIRATPETVFRFLTENEHWAAWWGAGSTIDPQPGGRAYIRYPNGVEVLGEVLELVPGRSIAMTYGFASGNPIPAGSSKVTISLAPTSEGTLLHLRHEFAEVGPRDQHVQGWRFQLSVFANVVASGIHNDCNGKADAWFAAWAEPDASVRGAQLDAVVTPGIVFRDRYSLLNGREDLDSHISASQRFMPGITLRRAGEARHCQGTVLADWVAVAPDGTELMAGTNVFELAGDGRICSATGIPKS